MASFRIYACTCFFPCASPVRLARPHPTLFRLNKRNESLIIASRPWSSFFQTTFCTQLPGVRPGVRTHGSEHENTTVVPEGTVASVVSAEAEGDREGDSRLVHVELQKELAESYLSYAMSVLLGRALPDVRDGLKPVHRRILFAMHELGLASKKPFKKSARVVGEVLGKFHPHGDSAVYDALVRMAQDFSLRSPLIAGHGNFGSLDADPPAAMRYTECRLDPLAEEMLLADLGQDTVAFTPNFDGSQEEPSVFPARLPNILLNGASGIAVGMATNIPPHNLGEVVDALCALIHNSNATVQELMEFLPGPDFPTGGQILGTLGILAAYRTGRGKIIVRGTAKIEEANEKNQRSLIVITEIPFQTNKAALVKQMSDLVENKTLEGISDLLDESDRDGMRVVVEVKRGANAAVVLNNLYKHTKLQTSFNCNVIGILGGKPELMGLKEILQSFLEFRCSVVTRRANYMLKQAEDRDHIIKGMLIGLEHLDLFVETTRNADNASVASELLQKKLNLTHVQADALLSMTVRRFTGLERKKLMEEHTHLESQINDLKALLASKARILQLVEKEALALKRDFATPRRTNLVQSDDGELTDIDIIANEDALVVISERGYIKRMKPFEFAAQRRGTWGKSSGKLKTNDTLSDSVFCRTHDYLLFFSEKGIVYSTRVFQIPELSRTATGTPLVQLIHIPPGERITSIKAVTDFPADQFLVMLTSFGYIKRTPLQLFSGIRVQGITAIQLVPGDELKLVKLAAAEDTIVIGSQHGNVIRVVCDETRFRALSRHARGVKSMRFKDGDKPATMDIVQAGVLNNLREKGLEAPWLLFVTGRGYGKRVPLSAFPVSRLGRVGVKGYNFIHKEDWLASIFLVGTNVADDGETTEEVILASNGGVMNRFKVRDVSTRKNRITSGIMLMRLEENDKVNSVSLVSSLNSDENSEASDEQALNIIEP